MGELSSRIDINEMIERLRAHPESEKIGMIASHLGLVRGNSRDGRTVTEIQVIYSRGKIDTILKDIKDLDGIIDVLIDFREGNLKVGDEILAVAGDIRENVFPALIDAVNRLKNEACKKKEIYHSIPLKN